MSFLRRLRGGLLMALLVLVGCEGEEYAILITAYGEGEFPQGSTIDVTVRDLQSSLRATSPQVELEDVVPEDVPLRIGIELHAPGQYLVHIAATDSSDVRTATRCFSVIGVTRSEVLLVSVGDLDADGDTWPTEETCRERTEVEGEVAEIGCRNPCPTPWNVDCNDLPEPDEDNPDGLDLNCDGSPDDSIPAGTETNPAAPEKCQDGVDQDCDCLDAKCEDADGDGFTGCPPEAAEPDADGDADADSDSDSDGDAASCDCDDSTRSVNPGVVESTNPRDGLCANDVDDDCKGGDIGCDGDGDGVPSCIPGGPTTCDCDDTNKDVMPGATETPGGQCDGLDNNCNGLVDEVSACLSDDLDGDGSEVGQDCNDCNAGATPGRSETRCGNGIDEDCAGGDEACAVGDGDRDGYVGQGAGGSDCDDDVDTVYPGAPDRCADGVDQDCSGADSTCDGDGDSDGWSPPDDCDDGEESINPGQVETCNGVDDDCDGVVNEAASPDVGCVNIPARDPGGDGWVDVDFATDLQNCGGCRSDCNPACDGTLCQADSCAGGSCSCGGSPPCGGGRDDYCCPDGCRNTTNDVNNCGGCGAACPEPPCHTRSCDAGVCRTEPEPDGTGCGGGRICCGGECIGECLPGGRESGGGDWCDRCGTRERRCTDGCTWGDWGGCQSQGECEAWDEQTQGCGNCGDQTRRCGGNCRWDDWGLCFDQGCAPGATQDQGCGNCGTQTQRCRNDCTWGGWGDCEGQGECERGAQESEPCGRCGTRTRTCNGGCAWGSWSACGGEGACQPGVDDSRSCGLCGTETRTCGGDCEWGGWGGCAGEGVCSPGTTTGQGCNNCAERTCQQDCTWGQCGAGGDCAPNDTKGCETCGTQTCSQSCQWGTCQDQGVCSPPADRDCGNCGRESCTQACQWSGNCQGEGVCVGGTTEECGNCGTRTCSSQTCQWGNCQGEGVCVAGTERDCEFCGTQTCSNQTCQWVGNCTGVCRPGDTDATGCTSPQVHTCSGSCQWGPCA